MDPGPRAAFNRAWSPALHRRYLSRLSGELGPLAVPGGRDAVLHLPRPPRRTEPERAGDHRPALATGAARRADTGHPGAVPRAGHGPAPKLRPGGLRHHAGAGRWARGQGGGAPGLPLGLRDDALLRRGLEPGARLGARPGGRLELLDAPGGPGRQLLGDTILGGEPPESVVLVDFEPEHQKTRPDFVATRKLFGVEAVCPTELVKEGRRLFRRGSGRAARPGASASTTGWSSTSWRRRATGSLRLVGRARRHLVQPPQLVLDLEQGRAAPSHATRRCRGRASCPSSSGLPPTSSATC